MVAALTATKVGNMAIGPTAIRVNAVLSAFRDNENSDVIDALSYFFIPILDTIREEPVTASLLAKAAGLIYGWSMTNSVGEVFLERLAQNGHIRVEYDKHEKHYFAQANALMKNDIDSSIKYAFENVVELFRGFELIANDLIYRKLSDEELGDMLVRFLISLDAHSNEEIAAEAKATLSTNADRQALEILAADTSVLGRAEVHICARFLQWLGPKHPELTEKLNVFVAAGMLAELVEDFRKPTTIETNSDATFFLDGPMLLGLIGTSGRALQVEARAIVNALKSIGCKVHVFTESCREAERVLKAYLKAQPTERHGRTHTAVIKGEVTRDYVGAIASDVEEAAKKFGVDVRDYDITSYPNDHKYFNKNQNDDIYSYLSWTSADAREHDAFAVTAIMRLRKGKHRSDPLRNSHVFISSNEKLVRRARDYCVDSGLINEGQCGPVVDIRDMATVAWLRTGFADSERLPISHMLAQCERVLRVRKDVIDAAIAATEKYSPEQREQFELLLQDNRAVNFLMDTARGSPAAFNPDLEQKLLDGMLEAAIRVVREETQNKLQEKDRLIRRLRSDHEKSQQEVRREYEAKMSDEATRAEGVEKRLAELEQLRDRDQLRLKEIEERQNRVMADGVKYANKRLSRLQFVGSTILIVGGGLASLGVFWDPTTLPKAVEWGSNAVALIGVFFTLQALRGRPVPGLWQIAESHCEAWYGKYCLNRGVPIEVATQRLEVVGGRLRVKPQEQR